MPGASFPVTNLRFLALVALLSAGACAPATTSILEERATGYSFIRPLLDCSIPEDPRALAFNRKIEKSIDALLAQKKASHIAYYYRDLNNGPLVSINGNLKFSPASLLKLPILLAYLKWAETEPAALTRLLVYEPSYGDDNAGALFPPSRYLIVGQAYTVEQLLGQMIRYSDNNAKNMLFANLPGEILTKVLVDFAINWPEKPSENYMSITEYSGIFRMLYNATYLTKDLSEKALKLLSEADFARGLRSGTPPSVAIAHKFGERHLQEGLQLHDCGIVYHPKRPYLLCVLTRGKALEDLALVMQQLAHETYEEASR